MKSPLVLIGGGGHGKSVLDVIRAEGRYEVIGILDVSTRVGESVMGVPIIGTDADIPRIAREVGRFLIGVGHLGNAEGRMGLLQQVQSMSAEVPNIVSPIAYVSPEAQLGPGTVVFHRAVVNAMAKVGANCVLNTGSIVEHDSVLEDNVHVSTQAVVNGECEVGEGSFLGSGSVINHGITIGPRTIIASGAVVCQATEGDGMYAGVPARLKKRGNK